METTDLLLTIIGGMWTVLLALCGYCLKRISDKVDDLIVHREDCLRRFADKASNEKSHARLFEKSEDHERRIVRLEARAGQ